LILSIVSITILIIELYFEILYIKLYMKFNENQMEIF